MEGVTKRNTFFYGQADPKGGMGGVKPYTYSQPDPNLFFW